MNRGPLSPDRSRTGFTLVELLIVIAVLGVVVGVFLPRLETSIPDRLAAAIRALASDLEYTRELAVANNSRYRLQFSVASNEYELTHRGSNPALDDLPASAYLKDTTSADGKPAQRFRLDSLPGSGAPVQLHAVLRNASALNPATIEFDSLGETDSPAATDIWLRAGTGDDRRFQRLTVSPVTGLTKIHDLTSVGPSP